MDKLRQWTVLTVVAVLAVLAGGYFLLVSPQRSHAAALRQDAEVQRQANASLQARITSLRLQAADLPRQQARLAQLMTKVPDDTALPTLIRALSGTADSAGVELVSIAPGTPQLVAPLAGATPAAAPAAEASENGAGQTGDGKSPAAERSSAATASTARPLTQIPVNIQVTGSYFNIEQFLDGVENLSRAMLVTGVTISSGKSTGSGSSGAPSTPAPSAGAGQLPSGALTASLTAQVFLTPTSKPAPTVKPAPQASAS